ncbi:hypothetical protein D3C72_591770 [compost metagenome]
MLGQEEVFIFLIVIRFYFKIGCLCPTLYGHAAALRFLLRYDTGYPQLPELELCFGSKKGGYTGYKAAAEREAHIT